MGTPDQFNWNMSSTDPQMWALVAELRAKNRELQGVYAELVQAYAEIDKLTAHNRWVAGTAQKQAAYIDYLTAQVIAAREHIQLITGQDASPRR